MSDALRQHVRTARKGGTPQSEPARKDQVKNNAGGFTFTISEASQLHRFLTIGTAGGTYHVGEKKLTKDNAQVVIDFAERSAPVLISKAVEISQGGRAPSNDPALFALAAAAGLGDKAYRQKALDMLPLVARTGSHLLTFVEYVEMFRGWGPQLVRGVRRWYTDERPARKDGSVPDQAEWLAYQLLKYKQRNSWSQRDVLRLCARKSGGTYDADRRVLDPVQADIFAYVMKGADSERLPELVHTAEGAHFIVKTMPDGAKRTAAWVRLIEGNSSLSWEMLPSEALKEAAVWRALFDNGNLPPAAMLRNLSRLTNLGVLKQGDAWTQHAMAWLSDSDRLTRARVHPISILLALKTYAQGHSIRGKGTWTPVSTVTDGLDAAFYAAFGAVEASGKRLEVALDISGTMAHPAGGLPISCREVVAAMSMVTMAAEKRASIYGFGHSYMPLDISPRRRLDDIVSYTMGLGMQRTDCALPMVTALKEKREVDVFQIWTDNETWYGRIHPHQALEQYREKMGIDARLEVVAVVPTNFSIADPLDPRQLDVSGFDSAVPNLLSAHARGDL